LVVLIVSVLRWVAPDMRVNHEGQKMSLDYVDDKDFDAKPIKRVGPVQLHEGVRRAWGWWCITNDVTNECSFYQYRPAAEIMFSRESQPYEKAEAV
jgi:hypothetical protein